MQDRVALQRSSRKHRAGTARSDIRWLLAWGGVFAAAIVTLLVAHQIYRLTGPHPQMTLLIRMLKHEARTLIPGLKGRRSSQLIPVPPAPPLPHYAGSPSSNGQAAQRART